MISLEQRYQGCLLGLAAGDAVGTTVEFKPPGTFPLVEDMVGGGPFGLDRGGPGNLDKPLSGKSATTTTQ